MQCQEHCNPADFPELVGPDGWVFNSSAAEQANVWFVGFQPIVREMVVSRYNFFLDEMIFVRNRAHVEELERRNLVPFIRDEEELIEPRPPL